jgi:hypothetical protein
MEGVTTIKLFLNMRQGHLFVLTHYRVFLKTIAHAHNYIFPSLVNNTHIVRPMNEITRTFDHLSTQLALVGLQVKMLKCKLWNSLRISPNIKILQGYTLVIDGLRILGVSVASQDFVTHFLNEVLSQDVVHIKDLPFLGDTQITLGFC